MAAKISTMVLILSIVITLTVASSGKIAYNSSLKIFTIIVYIYFMVLIVIVKKSLITSSTIIRDFPSIIIIHTLYSS